MAAAAAAARRRRVRRPLGVDLAKAAAGRRARSSSAFLAAAQEKAAGSMAPPRLAVGRSRGGRARHRLGQGGGREEGTLVLGVLGGGSRKDLKHQESKVPEGITATRMPARFHIKPSEIRLSHVAA
uniref:Uncharacterized protein n=1 Tax=Oryza barthii TaxID=65489 RepID=A0A0D3F645_9ORYZ